MVCPTLPPRSGQRHHWMPCCIPLRYHSAQPGPALVAPGHRLPTGFLCSTGERSTEHLLGWCPAVAAAWDLVSNGSSSNLRQACEDGRTAARAAAVLHQASFLYHALYNLTSIGPAEGARRIARAVWAKLYDAYADDDDGDTSDCDELVNCQSEDRSAGALDQRAWSNEAHNCTTCHNSTNIRHRPRAAWRRSRGAYDSYCSTARPVPIARRDCQANTLLGTLFGPHCKEHWPFHSPKWCPRPVTALDRTTTTNTFITHDECQACGNHRIGIHAAHGLKRGDILLAPPALHGQLIGVESPADIEMTFDGATHKDGDRTVAAAAAVATIRDQTDGTGTTIYRVACLLPLTSLPNQAEAWGARAADIAGPPSPPLESVGTTRKSSSSAAPSAGSVAPRFTSSSMTLSLALLMITHESTGSSSLGLATRRRIPAPEKRSSRPCTLLPTPTAPCSHAMLRATHCNSNHLPNRPPRRPSALMR